MGHGLRLAAVLVIIGLAACGPRVEPYRTAARPVTDGFAAKVPAGHTKYDNGTLADLFVRLTHGLESGMRRKALQRFETPINVGLMGAGSERYATFTRDFLAEIEREAGVEIGLGAPPHNLLVQFVPGRKFLTMNSNQCLVAFGKPDWDELITHPERYGGLVTQEIDEQTAMSVFIPDTIEPFRIRECLLEEIPQALGTANDLYGLASSVFNDDNAHSWPTRIDYLMLRLLYHPEMRSGLTVKATRRRAAAVLDEINPTGRNAPPLPAIQQKRFAEWRNDLLAMNEVGDPVRALWIARRLAERAHRMAPDTAYDCSGATFLAAAARDHEASARTALLEDAITLCTRVHGADDIRIARLRLRRSYDHLDAGHYAKAREEIEAILPALLGHALDGNVAAAYIVMTTAAWKLEDPNWNKELLRQAAAWSAYAYGEDHELTVKLRP